MFQPTDYPPLPGMWITRAQDALDALSGLSTPDEVTTTFGSARTLTEAILGTPIAGGTTTKRTIRAVGHLLTHDLGPALAAEALSWAAAIGNWISPSSIEMFLEHAAASKSTFRPLRVSDSNQLLTCIEETIDGDNEAKRRQALLRYWDGAHPSGSKFQLSELAPPTPTPAPLVSFRAGPSALRPRPGSGDTRAAFEPSPGDAMARFAPETQIALLRFLSDELGMQLATGHALFELAEPVVGQLLIEHTALVLENPECPDELKNRVFHPYDEATLELALRAGPAHFEVATVRRLLDGVDATEARRRIGEELFWHYLEARGVCGLISATDLISGDLAQLDLCDPTTAIAVFGSERRHPADFVAEVLIGHRQACSLVSLMRRLPDRTWTTAQPVIRRILDEAPTRVAGAVLNQYSVRAMRGLLTPADRDAAMAAKPRWVANCPGIPADQRPQLAWTELCQKPVDGWPITFYEEEAVLVRDNDDSPLLQPDPQTRNDLDLSIEAIEDDWFTRYYEQSAGTPGRRNGNFVYPNQIRRLEGSYSEAPGWTVSLPTNAAELQRNARRMRNCTASYEGSISKGVRYIVIVRDPDGQRFNVQIDRCRSGGFRVSQINSWANKGLQPVWIKPAFQQRLIPGAVASSLIVTDELVRQHHPRRTRRRERASRARRAKR